MICDHIDTISRMIAELNARIEYYRANVELLASLPDVDSHTAETIIAEIGTDMSRLPDRRPSRLLSRSLPGNNETGGKSQTQPHSPRQPLAQAALGVAAIGAIRTKRSYLNACSAALPRTATANTPKSRSRPACSSQLGTSWTPKLPIATSAATISSPATTLTTNAAEPSPSSNGSATRSPSKPALPDPEASPQVDFRVNSDILTPDDRRCHHTTSCVRNGTASHVIFFSPRLKV